MPAHGTFFVKGPIDQILDKFVQARAELKAKVNRIDKEKNEIYGNPSPPG